MNPPAELEPASREHPFRTPLLYTLLVLLVILGGWFTAKMLYAGKQKAVVEEVENLGGVVWFDYQLDAAGNEIPSAEPPGPPWLRHLLGDDFFTHVTRLYVRQFNDQKLEHLAPLSQLQGLDLTECEVTDAGLSHLEGLAQLRTLNLRGLRVTDTGMERLRRLTELRSLDLTETGVGEEGVKRLGEALPRCKISR